MRKKILCPFCLVKQAELARHVESMHAEEREVRKILRKCETLEERNLYNYRRNVFRKLTLRGCGQINT